MMPKKKIRFGHKTKAALYGLASTGSTAAAAGASQLVKMYPTPYDIAVVLGAAGGIYAANKAINEFRKRRLKDVV